MPPVFPESLYRKARRIGRVINGISLISPTLAGKMTYKLMCLPRHRPFKSVDKAFLDTAETSYLFCAETRICVYHWDNPTLPDAPKILLAHGWESHSGRWRDYVPALHDAGYSVVAFDAPAHGNSDGKILNGILYGRAITSIVAQIGPLHAIIGHSMGGTAALIGLTRTNMIPPKKVIIMGAPTNIQRITDELCALFALSATAISATYAHIAAFAGRPLTDLILHNNVHNLGHVAAFIMHDTDDDVAPVAEGRLLAANWPGATYLETKGFGHRFLPPDQAIKEVISRL